MNLEEMTLQGLYGNLLTHEIKVQQRQRRIQEVKNKGMALLSIDNRKSVVARPRLMEEEDNSDEEEDENEQVR